MDGKDGLKFNADLSEIRSVIHDILDNLEGFDHVKSNVPDAEFAIEEVKPVSDVKQPKEARFALDDRLAERATKSVFLVGLSFKLPEFLRLFKLLARSYHWFDGLPKLGLQGVGKQLFELVLGPHLLVEHAESNVFEECSHVLYTVDIDVLLYNLNQEIFGSVLVGNSQIDNISLNLHLFLEHLLVSDELSVGELEHDLENLACN